MKFLEPLASTDLLNDLHDAYGFTFSPTEYYGTINILIFELFTRNAALEKRIKKLEEQNTDG